MPVLSTMMAFATLAALAELSAVLVIATELKVLIEVQVPEEPKSEAKTQGVALEGHEVACEKTPLPKMFVPSVFI